MPADVASCGGNANNLHLYANNLGESTRQFHHFIDFLFAVKGAAADGATATRCQSSQRRLTRKPRTGLPPGSLHTRGTAMVAVMSSQMVWMRPSVPWGTSGRGSLLINSLRSTGTCTHTHCLSAEYGYTGIYTSAWRFAALRLHRTHRNTLSSTGTYTHALCSSAPCGGTQQNTCTRPCFVQAEDCLALHNL